MVPQGQIRNVFNPLNFIVLILVVCVLYFTRDVCIPLMLAVLLSFVLSPVVGRLQKWRVPRVPAVFLVLVLLLASLALGAWLVGGQLVSLAEKLPQYQTNVHDKLKAFQPSSGGVLERFNNTLDSYSREFEALGSPAPATTQAGAASPAVPERIATATAPETSTAPSTAPIPVAIVKVQVSRLAAIENMMMAVLGPLTNFGIVIILALFILIRQEDVRDRAIRLLGHGQLQAATRTLDDAGARVSNYLFIQLLVNVSFGLCIGAGLFLIGVPYSLLWGLLAAGLRFIPYFGAPLAALPPLLLAFAAMPGWTAVVLTMLLFAALEFTIANLIEPWLYGSSAKISPLAILASAIFWYWLWGSIGLLLSMPITVCLVVIGRHVPRLWFLSVLLGDEPVLAPEVRFYQRLLAGDQAEAWELAEEKLRQSSLEELYDTMIIPALILAEEDRHREELDATRAKNIFQGIRELVEELTERPVPAQAAIVPEERAAVTERVTIGEESGAASGRAPAALAEVRIWCLPARDEADELAGLMLAHLLARHGVRAEVVSCEALAGERLEAMEAHPAGVVCVSAVPPQALRHARYLCKRLRGRLPDLKIVAGLWGDREDVRNARERISAGMAQAVATSLRSAAGRLLALASHEAFRTDGAEGASPPKARGADSSAEPRTMKGRAENEQLSIS